MLNIFIVFGSLRMNYSLPRKVLLGIISDNETLYTVLRRTSNGFPRAEEPLRSVCCPRAYPP